MSDLDRKVAEIVGWPTGGIRYYVSEDVATAVTALEAMRAKGWRWALYAFEGRPPYICTLSTGYEPKISVHADTLPLAICKAIVATEEQ